MSTLKFQIETKLLDFSPVSLGTVTIVYKLGNNFYNFDLQLKNGFSPTGYFERVVWIDGMSGEHEQQAINYVSSFTRDFNNVGGSKNIWATAEGNIVTIHSKDGEFPELMSGYSGNALDITWLTVDNDPIIIPLSLAVGTTSIGNCNLAQYNLLASGGVGNYILKNGTTTIDADWDGSSLPLNLTRSWQVNLNITDTVGNVAQVTVNVPRRLAVGEFQESLTQYGGFADVLVQSLNPVSGTTPLEYALTDVGDSVGSGYQSSNTFPGVIAGQYRLWIKDVYGCEISKIIDIPDVVDPDQTTVAPYFEICEGQSLIASEYVEFDKDNPKNYFNSGSYNQTADVRYLTKQFLLENDVIGIQFKSSFNWHYITLHKCNGEKIDIPSIMIQENLGVAEKVDCELFPINGQTGVWFNGGNEYEPNSTTVKGASGYNKTTPRWNQIGQFVYITGHGSFEIVSNGYDNVKGGYFVLDFSISSEESTQVQATYNAQQYNLFEFYFQASLLDDEGFILIERAFDGDGSVVGNPWLIEKMKLTPFDENMLHLKWSDTKNKGGIVFQSGITFSKRCYGEFNPLWDDESETYKGDQSEFSLEQSSYLDFEIIIEAINQKEITQLNIASGLEGFTCNNLALVRKAPPEISRMGKSNLYKWKCEFAYGENNLAIKQDEIVLNVGTGVVGGGGSNPAPDLSGIQLYKDSNGNILNFGGKITKVG